MTQTVPATAVLGPGATGLTIGLRVLNLDGTEYAAFSTTGVAETSTLGTYRKASGVACPDAGAHIVWGVSGTDYAEATVEPITALSDIQARLPAALVGGLMPAALSAAGLATDASEEIADAVRSELAVELAHLDADVSTAGGGLTAQETRDAMKLAPTAGAAAAGSVDAHLDTIIATPGGLTAQEVADAGLLAPTPPATAAAGSVQKRLADLPATILTTAIAGYADTPGTVGYLLSLLAGLDFTAVNLVAASNAGEITIKRTLTLAAVVSGLTIPADWIACYWTVKRSTDDPDAEALVQILESNPGDGDDGVQVLAGEAVEDGSDGSLTVNQAGGTVAIVLGDASTALLEDAVELVWDVKFHNPAGKAQPGAGTATITTAVTRA